MRARELFALTLIAMVMLACGGSTKEASASGEASEEGNAMTQLEAMSADLTAKMDAAKAPIDKVDPLVSDLQALPGKLSISASDFNAACTATIETGQVQVSAELTADVEAKAEIESVLTQLQTLTTELKATPDNAQALLEAAGTAAAKLPTLASEVTAECEAKIKAPLGVTEEAKAAAQEQLNALPTVQESITSQIENAKSLSTELPQMATEALGKITAALSASTPEA
jgi:ribosome-associated translation inhibitor RaiA